MKKLFLLFALMFSVSSSFISCRDEAGREEEQVEEATDELEDAADDVEDEF